MTKTIHHTIIKSAAKLGAKFGEEQDGGFYLTLIEDETKRSLESWDSVGEAMEALREGAVTYEAPKGPKLAGRCGVMVAGYHAIYSHNPHGPGCNDDLDCTMRNLMTITEGKATRVDTDALRATGDANGLWNPRWDTLNPGMQRMNLANRLRGWLRNNDGVVFLIATDGTQHDGRFGVSLKEAPAKKAAPAPKAETKVAKTTKARKARAAKTTELQMAA